MISTIICISLIEVGTSSKSELSLAALVKISCIALNRGILDRYRQRSGSFDISKTSVSKPKMLSSGYQSGVMVSLLTVTATLARIKFDDWHCGSNEFTRKMWFDSITEQCEGIMLAVNHCCVMHDECYTHQRGQENCDKKFCECNRRASIKKIKCRDLLETSCSLVQLFGFGAYLNSANYTEPSDLVKYTLHSDYLKDRYSGIYGLCPKVNATLSSCALQHNLCQDPAVECAGSLSQCLHDAATVDGSGPCRDAVVEMCDATLEEANSWRNILKNPRYLGVYALKLMMGLCLVTFLLCIFRLLPLRHDDEKMLKYWPV